MQIKEKIKKINNLRTKIKKTVSVGSWVQFNSCGVIESMCSSYFDWICLDMEHGEIRPEDLIKNITTIENKNKLAFIRLAVSNEENCKISLESGAAGIIFPNFKNHQEVKNIIKYTDYKLSRGCGFSRCNNYGKNLIENFKLKPFIVVMIENIEIINDLKNVIKIPNIDAYLIGPYDLYNSFINHGGSKKDFNNYLNKLIGELKKYKKTFGIHVVEPDKKILKKRIKQGFKFIPYGIDSTFLSKSLKN
jgi:2-dehydro-3-deoxyglucarate aldolase